MAIVEFVVAGAINVGGGLPGGASDFDAGDAFSITFQVETSVSDTSGGPLFGIYPDAVLTGDVLAGAGSISASSGLVFIQPSDQFLSFSDMSIDSISADTNGLTLEDVSLGLDQGDTPDLLTTDSLIDALTASSFELRPETIATAIFDFRDGSNQLVTARGAITSVTFVPAPGTAAFGLLGIVAMRRRR